MSLVVACQDDVKTAVKSLKKSKKFLRIFWHRGKISFFLFFGELEYLGGAGRKLGEIFENFLGVRLFSGFLGDFPELRLDEKMKCFQ